MTPSEIAELREFISGELQKVHTRFDGVDGRFDGIDEQLDQVRTDQLDFQQHVGTHFAKVYEGLNDVSSRLSHQETRSEEMRNDFRAFGENLESANRKIGDLRAEMDTRFQDLWTGMVVGFRDVRAEMADGFRAQGEVIRNLEGC